MTHSMVVKLQRRGNLTGTTKISLCKSQLRHLLGRAGNWLKRNLEMGKGQDLDLNLDQRWIGFKCICHMVAVIKLSMVDSNSLLILEPSRNRCSRWNRSRGCLAQVPSSSLRGLNLATFPSDKDPSSQKLQISIIAHMLLTLVLTSCWSKIKATKIHFTEQKQQVLNKIVSRPDTKIDCLSVLLLDRNVLGPSPPKWERPNNCSQWKRLLPKRFQVLMIDLKQWTRKLVCKLLPLKNWRTKYHVKVKNLSRSHHQHKNNHLWTNELHRKSLPCLLNNLKFNCIMMTCPIKMIQCSLKEWQDKNRLSQTLSSRKRSCNWRMVWLKSRQKLSNWRKIWCS